MLMLLMLRVVVPVFLRVTDFAAAVAPTTKLPQVRDAGVTVTVGPATMAVTSRLKVVVLVKIPDVPLTVTVTVPVAAVALAVRVRGLVVVAGLGLKAAVTPLGNPVAERLTLPLNPFIGVMVIVLAPLLPCETLTLVADREKPGLLDGQWLTRLAAFTEPIPVAKSQPVVVP